jgi:hypothetical protein
VSGSDLFVTNYYGNTVGEYTTSGATVNASLVGVDNPDGIAVSGSDLFVVSEPSSVAEYTTSGALVFQSCTATSLSGGGKSGPKISVPKATAVTDQATLSGTNAATATGKVTYTVYSNAACTVVVSKGAAETITTPGELPASSPVSLRTAGTYYWQASYPGNSNNLPSVSECGSEVETVT